MIWMKMLKKHDECCYDVLKLSNRALNSLDSLWTIKPNESPPIIPQSFNYLHLNFGGLCPYLIRLYTLII